MPGTPSWSWKKTTVSVILAARNYVQTHTSTISGASFTEISITFIFNYFSSSCPTATSTAYCGYVSTDISTNWEFH